MTDTCSFEFSLWNDAALGDPGNQVGSTLSQSIDVADGRFSVELDFGAGSCSGEARWLEISVCCPPDDCMNPPNNHTALTPRQELTPAPYSQRAFTGVGPPDALEVDSASGRVGVGTTAPEHRLHVKGGRIRVDQDGGSPGVLLVREEAGVAWKTFHIMNQAFGPGNGDLRIDDLEQNVSGAGTTRFIIKDSGRVGINQPSPTEMLTVGGTIESTTGGFKFPDGTSQGTADTGDTLADLECAEGEVVKYDGLEWSCSADNSGGDGHSLDAADGDPVDAVLVDTEGRVGIGTTSPSHPLDVDAGSSPIGINAVHSQLVGDVTAIRGSTASATGRGVVGVASDATGVNAGVYGETASSEGYGVHGVATFPYDSYFGSFSNGVGVFGEGDGGLGSAGVKGVNTLFGFDSATGALGYVHPNVSVVAGVYGTWDPNNGLSYAGLFDGTLHVRNGNIEVFNGVKNFVIDHPLDPDNKLLYHASIESPEVLNVYRGTVVLNADGAARVVMPDYFASINKDFSYQLTPIGAAMPDLHVSRELDGKHFDIGGGAPGLKVCWQVMAVRNDEYARTHPMSVEVAKPEHLKNRRVGQDANDDDLARRNEHETAPKVAPAGSSE